jgi:DnaJ-class molecular chaperone
MNKYVREYVYKNVAVCGECEGLGEHVHYEHEAEEYGFRVKEKPVRVVCRLCEGSGLVEVIKEIRVTIKPRHNGNKETKGA